ncbi:MAG TPA: hypothetical protein VMN36_12565 [Verrucomicrobiales bacterium]|nr:hypothetical protein [Verrucomicrobiales bacterium]
MFPPIKSTTALLKSGSFDKASAPNGSTLGSELPPPGRNGGGVLGHDTGPDHEIANQGVASGKGRSHSRHIAIVWTN